MNTYKKHDSSLIMTLQFQTVIVLHNMNFQT